MTVRQIVQDYLKENGYDGLHCHEEDNSLGGCGCGIADLMMECGFLCDDCEPAYLHRLSDCMKCFDYQKCDPPVVCDTESAYCGRENDWNA
jgi:hypothetical protein